MPNKSEHVCQIIPTKQHFSLTFFFCLAVEPEQILVVFGGLAATYIYNV